MLPVGLIHVQNLLAACFVSKNKGLQLSSALGGTSRSGYRTIVLQSM